MKQRINIIKKRRKFKLVHLHIKYESKLCHFATTETLVITLPTHKEQDDVSCSKMIMSVTLKLYSPETF